MEIELMLDCRATIGESPTWDAGTGALHWIDVKEPALHRLAADGTRRSWTVPSDIGAFALMDGVPGAVVALRTGVFELHLGSGRLRQLAPPPFDPDLFRFNEGICDAEGRFWVGVMFDPRPGHEAPSRPGSLHRFTLAGGLRREQDQAVLHNGAAWSADGRTLFLSHSYQKLIEQRDYDPASGRIGPARPFATLSVEKGIPDGAAVDEEGCYWCAVHGGGALHRFDRSGRLVLRVELPVSQPTMCAFVGSGLDEMVVSSAREKLSPAQLEREPHAGGLFRLRPGVRGIPRPCVVR